MFYKLNFQKPKTKCWMVKKQYLKKNLKLCFFFFFSFFRFWIRIQIFIQDNENHGKENWKKIAINFKARKLKIKWFSNKALNLQL